MFCSLNTGYSPYTRTQANNESPKNAYTHSLTLSLSLCVYVYTSLSLSNTHTQLRSCVAHTYTQKNLIDRIPAHTQSPKLCLSLYLCIFDSVLLELLPQLSLSLSLSLYISIYISISVTVSLSLSNSLCIFFQLCLSNPRSISNSIYTISIYTYILILFLSYVSFVQQTNCF